MRRWTVLLLAFAAGCEAPAEPPPAPPAWVIPPQAVAWAIGKPVATIGRAQSPQLAQRVGITGSVGAQLRSPKPHPIPGDGPARAVVAGEVDGRRAIDLIDIDAGRIAWRDTSCSWVLGVTSEAIICSNDDGVRALDLDGKPRWHDKRRAVAVTGERVLLRDEKESGAILLHASTGKELSRLKLYKTPSKTDIVCGDAELLRVGTSQLSRITAASAMPAWDITMDVIKHVDGCEGATILVRTYRPAPELTSLIAVARDTGKTVGRIDGVLGHWPARDGSARIEVSTSAGIARWARDLSGAGEPLEPLPVGNLIAKRSDLRLVRTSASTAVLLDARGVRAFLPVGDQGAVLGDRALVAGTWDGWRGGTVERMLFPERYARSLRVPNRARHVAMPAELRDLPPVDQGEGTQSSFKLDIGSRRPVLDARELYTLVTAAFESNDDFDKHAVGIAAMDVGTKVLRWHEPEACGVGAHVGLALAKGSAICAVQRDTDASVHAVARVDGASRWQVKRTNIDRIAAAGDAVLVHTADRLDVLRASDGTAVGSIESDDGNAVRAAAVDINSTSLVVIAERNHVVARLPLAQMVPAWSVEVHGVVASIKAAGAGVLVVLEDGDAYRIDALTGLPTALPGISAEWDVVGDLIASIGEGGPVPPADWPPAAATAQPTAKKAPKRKRAAPAAKTAKAAVAPAAEPEDSPPRLMKPIAPPPDLRPSFQLALFELTGALRARNDYALQPNVTPGLRAPGAPLVLVDGNDDLLVLDPERGDPVRRLKGPGWTQRDGVFSTVVDGKPVVGALLETPLRLVLF